MTESEREAIQKLHGECTNALDKYLKEGYEMCRILSTIESHPVSRERREAIVRQRVKENDAQQAYDSARQALFTLAGWV